MHMGSLAPCGRGRRVRGEVEGKVEMTVVEGWSTFTVEQCCEILDSKRVPVNGEDREKRIGEVPYYGANGLQGHIDDFIFDEPLILIAEDGGTFDEFATRPIAYRINGKSWVNNHAHVLRAKKEFDQDVVFYSLEHKDIQSFIVGGTRSKLNQSALRAISFSLPTSKSEQSKIAEILSTVDRAIEQTEALIAKQQRIKTGLMQDLLTRGIDEHGNLRSEQTHEFKDSPLGKIPVEWEVKKLKDCYAEPARNGLYKPKEFYGFGQKMIHMPQMFRGLVVDVQSAVRVIVDRSEIDRFRLKIHDLLIARRSLVLEGAGRCSLVPEVNEPTTFESSIIRVRLKLNEFNAEYANFFFNSEAGYRMRLPFIRQVAVSGVSGEDVGEFSLPVPQLNEQNRIVEALKQSDMLIQRMTLNAQKLARMKTALMQDLLTGKKRVNILLSNTA